MQEPTQHRMLRLQQKMKSGNDAERRKGIPWTEEEHRLFLMGLSKFGKGDWRSISRNFVISRTPTQASQENLIPLQCSIMLCIITNSSSYVTSRSSNSMPPNCSYKWQSQSFHAYTCHLPVLVLHIELSSRLKRCLMQVSCAACCSAIMTHTCLCL